MIFVLYALLIIIRAVFLPDRKQRSRFSIDVLDHERLHRDLRQWHVSVSAALAIWIQHYIFPISLTVYLVLLLIWQTQLRALHLQWWYLLIDQNWIMLLVILSGIGSVYAPEQHSYRSTMQHPLLVWSYLVLVLSLGILGCTIIAQQTVQLGQLSWVIAGIAGTLLILIGHLLLDDEAEDTHPTTLSQ